MKKWTFDLREISLSRAHLMGLATLWIALFHSIRLNFYQPWLLERPHLMDLLNRLREEGNCGVDIFLFLSGIGLVFSWAGVRERSSHPLRTFYRRRLSRVLPPVLTVSVLYYGWIGAKDGADWLARVFLYGNFLPSKVWGQYWFFALLLVLYLLFPLIWKAVDRGGFSGSLGLIGISVLWTLTLKYWISEAYFIKTEILWTRIPVFIAGVYFGRLIRRGVRIPAWIPILSIPAAILLWYEIRLIPEELIWLRRYTYLPLTVFITLGHGWLCSLGKRNSWPYRAVTGIGKYSLELYLIYEGLYLYNPLGFQSPDAIGIIYAGTVFTLSLLLSALLRAVMERLRAAACAKAAG